MTKGNVAYFNPLDQDDYDDTVDMVCEFYETFGKQFPSSPFAEGWKESTSLQLKFVAEELNELSEAIASGDQAHIFKEMCDLQYVVSGMFVSTGLWYLHNPGMLAVHMSNMSKLHGGKVVRREDGKILKGPDYKEPDMKAILDAN
jgi:predicted HAD superfamily Cof-like phosphohydrolase